MWDLLLSADTLWFAGAAGLSLLAGFVLGALLVALITLSAMKEEWRAGWNAGFRACLNEKWKRDPMVSMYLEIKKFAEEGLDAATKEGQRAALKSILDRVTAALDTQKDWKRKNG